MNAKVLIIASIIVIVFCVVLIIELVNLLRKKQQMENTDKEIERDEKLEEALVNPDMEKYDPNFNKGRKMPYEVVYHTEIQTVRDRVPGVTLRIIEQDEFSTKKFRMRLEDHLLFGRDRDNDLVIENPTVSARHCELVLIDGKVFVRDLGSSNMTVLSRKKRNYPVGGEPIGIENHDILYLGDVSVQLMIMNE